MKRKLFMLCLAGMLLYTNPAFATPFPDKTDQIVQDSDKYLKKEEITKFEAALKDAPGTYKVVVVENTSPEADTPQDYATKLFDNYNLPDDALMVVLNMETEQLGIFAGPALKEKGANEEMLQEKITSYYEPFRNQKQYLTGIQTLITEVYAEINRLESKPGQAAATDAEKETKEAPKESDSLFGGIPWWIYAIGAVFAGLSIGLIYAMIRRRSIFAQVDEVEDWKEELVEKINVIEVDKPMRRSSGTTEVRYHHLADQKENLLRNRIPDVEMMILDAEEACDRFRFSLALGMLDEARETLTQIEQELTDLKSDTTKVAVTKQENKVVIPEIGKLVEQIERRLSDLRLEYGLSFHELKSSLDEVETMRSMIKTSRAAGDDLQAYNTTLKAQQLLERINGTMEQIPTLVHRVKKEMPEEFKQLEAGIDQAVRDGYDFNQDALENALLQAKQLLTAAKSALEEGSLETLVTHQKAFEVLIDTTYQTIDEGLVAKKQIAASAVAPVDVEVPKAFAEEQFELREQPDHTVLYEEQQVLVAEEKPEVREKASLPTLDKDIELPVELETTRKKDSWSQPVEDSSARTTELSEAERLVLLQAVQQSKKTPAVAPATTKQQSSAVETNPVIEESPVYEEEEYELVIPKLTSNQEEFVQPAEEPDLLVIETEDDALDELERISNTLVRIRQQIKRSYLPGIPDQLKYMFEEIIQTLARVQGIMEEYRYDLEEVAILIQDANDLVEETEKMAERIIATCQLAEGAIQYTNRYRRQNRQVNELLTKAEQSFRQLAFAESYQLAEDARLVVEGAPVEEESGWLLRRKKKG
ncbi:septation ring formation regulator EzrA [Brevibacillus reuszeri]|uniref:Negative regulator of septation ring formation n=1 Tax=Brevibacillus reuszeri TaxID=54915 RepID=A0A0K9YIP7_9BACL|nr:septation ring formation regulator EzrA [Brevibacillus reuszeri]KNB68546.1 negative regulator of septation ring formation [Brevibacillus reuszeri]MED1858825.1 septation ring formation regulator EzrA [Brevibacillus reuszeri]GED69040.1 septation ring formation regulator EzrA [Brevibacillus reuszeri]